MEDEPHPGSYEFPAEVESICSDGKRCWRRQTDLFAIKIDDRLATPPTVVARIPPNLVVTPGPEQEPAETESVPVYRLGDDGPIGVPTGLVFVRRSDGASLEELHDIVEQLGFKVGKVSPRGSSGWLTHQSGGTAEALREVGALVSTFDNVEPEFLMPRSRKGRVRPPSDP